MEAPVQQHCKEAEEEKEIAIILARKTFFVRMYYFLNCKFVYITVRTNMCELYISSFICKKKDFISNICSHHIEFFNVS